MSKKRKERKLAEIQQNIDNQIKGKFIVEWLDNRRVMLLSDVVFTDSNYIEWLAPNRAIINGADIPKRLWGKRLGSPYVGAHKFASVFHDVYIDRAITGLHIDTLELRSRNSVNKVFYEICLCYGMSRFNARAKYLAVKFGAPRWKI